MDFLESLINYRADDANDLKNKELCISLFKKNGLLSFDRKFYQDGHFTASGIVLNKNKTHILLTHHKFLDKWIQLGGHIDKLDNTVYGAALRECREESGIDNIELISNNIFDIDIHNIPKKCCKNRARTFAL